MPASWQLRANGSIRKAKASESAATRFFSRSKVKIAPARAAVRQSSWMAGVTLTPVGRASACVAYGTTYFVMPPPATGRDPGPSAA